jgi:hypothetical protein
MTPPPAHEAAIPAGWRGGTRIRRPRLRVAVRRPLGIRARLALLAISVLAATVPVAAYVTNAMSTADPVPPAGASRGTALLGTATCAQWRGEGVAKRLATIQALGLAATQPDPENAGATLRESDAYLLFARVCSHGAPGSMLLYEAYNRAASFRSLRP